MPAADSVNWRNFQAYGCTNQRNPASEGVQLYLEAPFITRDRGCDLGRSPGRQAPIGGTN